MLRLAVCLGAAFFAQPVVAQQVLSGAGAEIRVLDRLTGEVTNLVMQNGAPQNVGGLSIMLADCRYPAENAAAEGYANLLIHFRESVTPIFSGWMMASSPALNALDHPRYDVWLLRCTT